MRQRLIAAIFTLALMPSTALAHPGHSETAPFASGLVHPLTGIDHLLAMVTLGLVAYGLGGRSRWLLPLTFLLGAALGGAFALFGLPLVGVETGIALSVVTLGALVATRYALPLWAIYGAAISFAAFHGYAHMNEMPVSAPAARYAAGFLLTTGLLHCAGLGLGASTERLSTGRGPAVARAVGGAVCLAGLALLVGAA